MIVRFALAMAVSGWLSSFAPAADFPSSAERAKGDLAIAARAILKKHCAECHDQTPGLFSVADHKQVVADRKPIPFVNLANPARSQVIEFIEDGSMPPGGRSRPSADDLKTLKAWVAAQAPSYPLAFDDRTTLAALLDDLDRQKPEDRAFLRYLSFAHLIRDEQPWRTYDLADRQRQLAIALEAASGKTAFPQPVGDTATLFRLDIRTLGWNARNLFVKVEKGVSRPDAYDMIPFDLLLLEYPDASVPLADKDPLALRLQSYLKAAKQLRPVPFLRADWVADILAPTPPLAIAPLASDLRSLGELAEVIKKKAEFPCGPPLRAFSNRTSAVPPVTVWYSSMPTPTQFELKVEVIGVDKQATTVVPVGSNYNIRVTTSRALRFILLNVLSDGTVNVMEVGGNLLDPQKPNILAPKDEPSFFMGGILNNDRTATEHFILIAAEDAVPLPAIVRSQHLNCLDSNRHPIWRFVFDKPADQFDSSKAIRRVLPIRVVRK